MSELSPEEEGQLAEVERGEDEAAAGKLGELAESMPTASEPFESSALTMAERAADKAIDKLSGGQDMNLPPVERGPDSRVLPTGLYIRLRIVSEFLKQSGAPPEVQFDADAAAQDPAALDDATDKLLQIGGGAKTSAPPKPAAKEKPPEKAPPGKRAAQAFRGKGKEPAGEEPEAGKPKTESKDKPPPGKRAAFAYNNRTK